MDRLPVPVPVKRLPHFEGLELPAYATEGAAGMDVLAAEDVVLAPGARHAVATGLAMAIPHGFEIQVRPRVPYTIFSGYHTAAGLVAQPDGQSWYRTNDRGCIDAARGAGGDDG